MYIINGGNEWDIPHGSFLQTIIKSIWWKKIEGKWKCTMRDKWCGIWIINEKVSAQRAIEWVVADPEAYRILSPCGVVVKDYYVAKRWNCRANKGKCDGYINLEGQYRVCEKCRSAHQWDRVTKSWTPIEFHGKDFFVGMQTVAMDGSIRTISKKRIIQGDFSEYINNKANQYQMVSTGSKEADNLRIRNYSKPTLDGSSKRRVITLCDDGKYRPMIIENVGIKIQLVMIYIKEVEPQIGDDMGILVDNKIKLKKYSGNLPTSATYAELVGEESLIEPKNIGTLCGRCGNLVNHDGKNWSKAGYCSEKCHGKESLKQSKEVMKRAKKPKFKALVGGMS